MAYLPGAMSTRMTIIPSGTTGQVFIKTTGGRLGQIHNSSVQTLISYSVYNAAVPGDVVAANLVYSGVALASVGPCFGGSLQLYFDKGICIVISGTSTSNIIVAWD